MRLTTIDLSLDKLIRGQLRYMNQYFEVIGVAKDCGALQMVGEREGVRVVDAPLERAIHPLKDVRGLWFLYRLFRRERPWIVHSNTPKGSLLGMIAAWMARVPNRIYTVTGLRYQGAQGMLRWVLKTMERLTCAFATKVVPEGQGVLHTLQADHITRKPLQLLHYGNINGVDLAFYSNHALATAMNLPAMPQEELACKQAVAAVVRERLGLSATDFVFVFVGRIVKDKGINELARCLEAVEGKLILVGSFDDDDPIEASARHFLQTSERVKCVGWQEDVRPYLAAADLMVFPSYREGFPNTPMQAGAMGVPAIVTNINGCNEIIKDNLNGKIILAPLAHAQGSEQMAQALRDTMQWCVNHREEVGRMGRNAREMIASRYAQQDVWAATLAMYQQL